MAKIGTIRYPDVSVPEASKYTKIIYDFPTHSMSVKMLTEKLNLSTRGGWTGMILYSLKSYGLVEGRGVLRTTELGEKLVNPLSAQELAVTKETVFNKIDLWTKIRKDYGEKALSSEFCSYLADKLLIDRTIAQSKYEKVAKLYTESVTFCFPPTPSNLNDEGGRRKESLMENPQTPSQQVPTPRTPSGTVSYGSSVDYNIWVRRDLKSIAFVESQIEAIKSWLKFQKDQIVEEQKS